MPDKGIIYLVLIRMQKEGLVETTMKKSPSGPKRKYYTITGKGQEELVEFKEKWFELSSAMNQLF
ncbi:PadR family transcriptional regulator [Domibacillus tundrae]|uniref:PadR family transcriptional regulator n=1 Tax=Domibacillus tundrae TaxID=1587527 RepID=UPI00248005A0|nr:PadR family transcriptional regulator [Domibacillus tundrae]